MAHCSFQRHYNEPMCDGDVGKRWERSSECAVQRKGTGDTLGVTGARQGCSAGGGGILLSKVDWVRCRSLETAQTLFPNTLPSHTVSLVLSKDTVGDGEWIVF